MSIEIEHKAGSTAEQIKHAEREAKKDALANSLGWSREKLDSEIENIKDYLTKAEQDARKKGSSTIKSVKERFK